MTVWLLWGGATLAAAAYLGWSLQQARPERTLFLPGKTSNGHYQIEVSCESCHSSPFTSRDDLQAACEKCHGQELSEVKDSHPRQKFTDPRNADRVARLDARYCVTCHVEHRPDATVSMGVTVPVDYCHSCHEGIAEERPSHSGLAFDTCASAGCHNFHDNRALYEDFLVRALDQPDHRSERSVHALTPSEPVGSGLSAQSGDAPPGHSLSAPATDDWASSAHGRGGVNCSGCHGADDEFQVAVPTERCRGCHQSEVLTFQQGRHGMRGALTLAPLTTAEARRPMAGGAKGQSLGCNSCHRAHEDNTSFAAVDACLGCHNDAHSQAYKASPHARLWWAEQIGQGEPGTGVSCASCHLPRHQEESGAFRVLHNQNATLRPSEKMVRGVCDSCHGVAFSLQSLADAEIVQSNFSCPPASSLPGLDMVRARVR